MKKIIFAICSLICFVSYGQHTEYLDDAKLTKFAEDLTKLPFTERDVILKAIDLFEQQFKNDRECADWAYQLLYYYHELSCEDKTNTLHVHWSDEQIRALKVNDIEVIPGIRSGMKDFEKEYSKYGYRVRSYEDTTYAIEVNPAFVFNKVEKYLTNDYRLYRSHWIKEHDVPAYIQLNPPYWHAKQVISTKEVMSRIQWRDELIDRVKDFSREDLVTREIEGLCFIVTKGLENTSIYDDKGVIKKEYKDALQTYYRSHTQTTWGKYMTEFVHRLALNKYRFSNDIDQWVLSQLFPAGRKNTDPLLKYEDILIDNLMD
ncbi:MAG: hypothetical protein J6M30_01585 [Bacteroidales bacterium]|nr:hypothetical protein [Bacteroidales bacterium]